MKTDLTKESIYDEKGNLKIPIEQVLDKVLSENARKNYEIAQLQVALEILQKELSNSQDSLSSKGI